MRFLKAKLVRQLDQLVSGCKRATRVVDKLVGAVLFLTALWAAFHSGLYLSEVSSDTPKLFARAETVARILTPIFGLFALWVAWQRSLSAERQVKTAEQGQVTERFTKAAEMLGDDRLAIRLGGIYSLERVSIDSERDQQPIMEILCAFLRVESHREQFGVDDKEVSSEKYSRREDLKACMRVVGRPKSSRGVAIDLRGVNLENANLLGMELRGADLRGANLRGASLKEADLSEAKMQESKLERTDFEKALFFEADLSSASLEGAILKNANFFGATLQSANLRNADLSGTRLFGTDLTDARNLESEQLACARTDFATKTPPEVQRPKRWRVRFRKSQQD